MRRAAAAGALLAACGGGLGTDGPVDGTFASTLIYGRVTASDGAGVANGAVRVEARALPQCSVTMDGASYPTDGTGAYRAALGIWGTPRDICVFVRATSPDTARLRADSTTRSPVRLDFVHDSVRVDLVLPERPPE